MHKRKNNFLILFFLIFIWGCADMVEMRDYTGVREGAFGLDVKRGFDQGVDKKDYYVIKQGVALIIGDTEKEVIVKIGLPDEISTTLDGHKKWLYKNRKINLFFKNKRLNSWNSSE
jgi:hypothetical protein